MGKMHFYLMSAQLDYFSLQPKINKTNQLGKNKGHGKR